MNDDLLKDVLRATLALCDALDDFAYQSETPGCVALRKAAAELGDTIQKCLEASDGDNQ